MVSLILCVAGPGVPPGDTDCPVSRGRRRRAGARARPPGRARGQRAAGGGSNYLPCIIAIRRNRNRTERREMNIVRDLRQKLHTYKTIL